MHTTNWGTSHEIAVGVGNIIMGEAKQDMTEVAASWQGPQSNWRGGPCLNKARQSTSSIAFARNFEPKFRDHDAQKYSNNNSFVDTNSDYCDYCDNHFEPNSNHSIVDHHIRVTSNKVSNFNTEEEDDYYTSVIRVKVNGTHTDVLLDSGANQNCVNSNWAKIRGLDILPQTVKNGVKNGVKIHQHTL